MKKFTFKRGIHPKENKSFTEGLDFVNFPTGKYVYIPLQQHIGAPAKPVVQVGDYVKAGTLIGAQDGFVSANVHSSVSGTVIAFVQRENSQGIKINHVQIENDEKYEEELLPKLVDPTKQEIIDRCKIAGIVGMGGATFPTHIKLLAKNKIYTLIINGSECEPYITTDHRLMLTKTKEVLEGIKLIRTALGADRVRIGIEDNKMDAIIKMKESITCPETEVVVLKTKYPQGGEKQLICAIEKKKVPNGGLPSDIGYIVLNISTAYAIYEAVILGKSCYARYMTVAGKGIQHPSNIYVRNGVTFNEIAEQLGTNHFVKILSGGPMMGASEANLNPCVAKGTSALLLLNESEIRGIEPSTCIHCGRCNRACPINLLPMMIEIFVQHKDLESAKRYNALSCIECGCCAYVCPAKRPLVQSQRLAKKLIKENKI